MDLCNSNPCCSGVKGIHSSLSSASLVTNKGCGWRAGLPHLVYMLPHTILTCRVSVPISISWTQKWPREAEILLKVTQPENGKTGVWTRVYLTSIWGVCVCFKHFSSTFYAPGTVLTTSQVLPHCILWGKYCYCLHCGDEETEAQRDQVTRSSSYRFE